MGYLTHACKYCNGDEKCFCDCHYPNPEKRDNRCNPEDYD